MLSLALALALSAAGALRVPGSIAVPATASTLDAHARHVYETPYEYRRVFVGGRPAAHDPIFAVRAYPLAYPWGPPSDTPGVNLVVGPRLGRQTIGATSRHPAVAFRVPAEGIQSGTGKAVVMRGKR